MWSDRAWGIDSEFASRETPSADSPYGSDSRGGDFHAFQLARQDEGYIFYCRDELMDFIKERKPRYFFGYNLIVEIGSLERLGFRSNKNGAEGEIKCYKCGSQDRATWMLDTLDKNLHKDRIGMFDMSGLGFSMGMNNLGELSGYLHKMKYLKEPKKQQAWHLDPHSREFQEYAIHDARIPYAFAEFLWNEWQCDPTKIASAASIAAMKIGLPDRLGDGIEAREYVALRGGKKIKARIFKLGAIEEMIRHNNYAGRSECFINGAVGDRVYMDVKSLYPFSLIMSEALNITGAVECGLKELDLGNKLDNLNYGWIRGVFETSNDLWGLPKKVRGRNTYLKGVVTGTYHTYDLAAAGARIIQVHKCWKPVVKEGPCHKLYVKLYHERFTHGKDDPLYNFIKLQLNGLTGRLGQSKPALSRRSNFYAYNTMLAHTHLVMSGLITAARRDCGDIPAGMDTDSLFTSKNIKGEYGHWGRMSLMLDVKGRGELFFMRNKLYIWKTEDKQMRMIKSETDKHFATGGWRPPARAFIRLVEEAWATRKVPQEFKTVLKKKRTLKNRDRSMSTAELGSWCDSSVEYNQAQLEQLMKCDPKRIRQCANSIELVAKHDCGQSQAWDSENLLLQTAAPRGYFETLICRNGGYTD